MKKREEKDGTKSLKMADAKAVRTGEHQVITITDASERAYVMNTEKSVRGEIAATVQKAEAVEEEPQTYLMQC